MVRSSKDMTWKQAIETVLDQAGQSMQYTEIADQIVNQGLREKVGATPANTVSMNISSSINNEGDNSPFVRVGRGEYILKKYLNKPKPDKPDEIVPDKEQTLVNCFGMYWERSYIDWNVTNPKLLGTEREGADPINFADQIGVYILYDQYRPIYVGRTSASRLNKRLREHTRISRFRGRWDRFSWFGVCPVSDKGKLMEPTVPDGFELVVAALEGLLIEAMEPVQNRRQGDGSGTEYIQVEDPNLKKKKQKTVIEEIVKKFSDQEST